MLTLCHLSQYPSPVRIETLTIKDRQANFLTVFLICVLHYRRLFRMVLAPTKVEPLVTK